MVLNVKETIVGLIPGIHLGCLRSECRLALLTGSIAGAGLPVAWMGTDRKTVFHPLRFLETRILPLEQVLIFKIKLTMTFSLLLNNSLCLIWRCCDCMLLLGTQE